MARNLDRLRVWSVYGVGLALLFGGLGNVGWAVQPEQPTRKVALSERAVDSLRFENCRLVGVVFHQTQNQLSLAVERAWLKQTYPKEFAKWVERERQEQQDITAQFESRMNRWLDQVRKDELYANLLEFELRRFLDDQKKAQQLPDGGHYQFMVFQLRPDQVTKLRTQPQSRKKIAALAWKHDLKDVSLRSHVDLRRELESNDVDIENDFVDLSNQLPPSKLTDRQWNIRQAMYDLEEAGGGLEFQGQGGQLFEIGENVDLRQVMAAVAGSMNANSIESLGRELGLPEFSDARQKKDNDSWIKTVTDKADAKSKSSVLVKRLLSSDRPDQVLVETSFLAKLDSGQWVVALQSKAKASLAAQPAEKILELKQDPQVQQAIALTRQLGLGGESRLEHALRQGAATQQALQESSSRVKQVLARNSRRLEGPWLLD